MGVAKKCGKQEKRSKASRLKKQSVNSRVKRNLVKKPSKRTSIFKFLLNIIISLAINQILENPIQVILFWVGEFVKMVISFW